MKERKEALNVVLAGDHTKCGTLFNQIKTNEYLLKLFKFSIPLITNEEVYWNSPCINFKEIYEGDRDRQTMANGDIVIYIDVEETDRAYIENYTNKNCMTIDVKDFKSNPVECLLRLKTLYHQRIEKSLLVEAGGKRGSKSDFSTFPTEVTNLISSTQFELSKKYSHNSFFQALVKISAAKPEEKKGCSIQ